MNERGVKDTYMGCSQSSPSVGTVPDAKQYRVRLERQRERLATKSRPASHLQNIKITSTVYRLGVDDPGVVFATDTTLPSPPPSPDHHNNRFSEQEVAIPKSPPLVFEPSKPFRVTHRLKVLYEKLRYQIEPLEEDEITHDEERQDALLLYGQGGASHSLSKLIVLLSQHSDNLFLHKLGWETCCRRHKEWILSHDHANQIVASIVAAFHDNEAHFFAFTSSQSVAIRLLYILSREYLEFTVAEEKTADTRIPWEVYLEKTTVYKSEGGLAIICMLLHTYLVNRIVFNFHFERLYQDERDYELSRGARGCQAHSVQDSGAINGEYAQSEHERIFEWAQRWLRNYDSTLGSPLSFSPPPLLTLTKTLAKSEGSSERGGDGDDVPVGSNAFEQRKAAVKSFRRRRAGHSNALETYYTQITASQELYTRVRKKQGVFKSPPKPSKYALVVDTDNDSFRTPVHNRGLGVVENPIQESVQAPLAVPDANRYIVDLDLVKALQFNRSDPHIFIQLYQHWKNQKYTPAELVNLNALTCVLGVMQRLDPEHIIYGSGMVAAILALVFMMEGPNAYETLISREKRRLQDEKVRQTTAQQKLSEKTRATASHVLAAQCRTTDSALQTLEEAGSTIHDAFIWADTNFELFPSTWQKHAEDGSVSIFRDGLPEIFACARNNALSSSEEDEERRQKVKIDSL